MTTVELKPYFRGDQASGITAPNLAKDCTYAEHICRARGKRTQFTSISLDKSKIRDFGDTIYQLKRDVVDGDKHETIEHETLIAELTQASQEAIRTERLQAVQALRRARRRREGLVRWQFDCSSVAAKDLIKWATDRVQVYFVKV